MNIIKEINGIIEGCIEDCERERKIKIVKTVKVKKDWLAIYAEYIVVAKKAAELEKRLKFLKKKFWVTVEDEVGCDYNKLELDIDRQEIDCFKEVDEKKEKDVNIEKELPKKVGKKK